MNQGLPCYLGYTALAIRDSNQGMWYLGLSPEILSFPSSERIKFLASMKNMLADTRSCLIERDVLHS